MTVVIRRQEHGEQTETISLTLPAAEVQRLRRERDELQISVSRRVVELLRAARAAEASAARPEGDRASA